MRSLLVLFGRLSLSLLYSVGLGLSMTSPWNRNGGMVWYKISSESELGGRIVLAVV